MKYIRILAVILIVSFTHVHADLAKPVNKSLGGSDSLSILIKGLPEEKYAYLSTLCGVNSTQDFKDGYDVARRLLRHGLKPHYLSYAGFKSTLTKQPKLSTVSLADYKVSKKLSESVNGYNFAMAMAVFDLKLKEISDKKEE